MNASSYFIKCPTNHTDFFIFFLSYMCVCYTMCLLYLFANVRVTGELDKCLVSELVFYFLLRVLFLHSDLYGELRDRCFFLSGICLQVWQHVAVVTTQMPTLQHREPLQRATPFFFSLELQVRFVEQSQ